MAALSNVWRCQEKNVAKRHFYEGSNAKSRSRGNIVEICGHFFSCLLRKRCHILILPHKFFCPEHIFSFLVLRSSTRCLVKTRLIPFSWKNVGQYSWKFKAKKTLSKKKGWHAVLRIDDQTGCHKTRLNIYIEVS